MIKRKESLISFLITWICIPVFLLLIWVGFSLFFTSKYSFSVIAAPHAKGDFTSYKTSELYKGQKLAAHFTALENNLGIVSVRFYNFQRISDDSVVFRIKEKNQQKWFYQQTYSVNQFQPDGLFTFGFPIIPNSLGKEYEFEVQSLKGKPEDAIGLSEVYPPFVSQYQFPKESLLADKKLLIQFVWKKLYYSFLDRNFLISSLVFLLPLIFYLFWCYFASVVIGVNINQIPTLQVQSKRIISGAMDIGYLPVHLFLLILFLLVLMMDQKNMYVLVLLIALWIWQIKVYRFDSSVSYFLSLSFLVMCPIFILIQEQGMADRSAIWVYLFLVIGTVMAITELKKDHKRTDYKAFIKGNQETLKTYVTKLNMLRKNKKLKLSHNKT